jgi:Zn-dependent peptidase ImmA (M78 family)
MGGFLMAVYKVPVNRDMLIWAREDAGYEIEDLPDYLEKVSKWESGEDKPTWKELRKLANKYKRPSVFFLLSHPPKEEEEDFKDYRRSSYYFLDESPELKLEIRKAKYRRNAVINIQKEMGFVTPSFSRYKFESNDHVVFAKKMRETLGVDIETQKSWIFKISDGKKGYNHARFLDEWKEIVTELGVLIFETEKVEKTEINGLALYKSEYPIILLNGKDSHNRRIFTLFHELTHLMMGESAKCILDKDIKKEAFCNKVAAEFLAPLEFFANESIVKENNSGEWSIRQLGSLSHIFGVSKQTILLRILTLKKISKKTFGGMFKQLKIDAEEKEKKKLIALKKRKRKGGMAPVAKKIKYEGKPYSRIIISAYDHDLISPVNFSRYMDLPVSDAEKLAEKIF